MGVSSDKLRIDGRYDLATAAVRILRGRDVILPMREMLVNLSARCDQQGAMDHLEYFLSRPKFVSKIPCLILFCSADPPSNSDQIEGAVLVYEYQVSGIASRIFVADYHGGDRTVITPEPLRVQAAFLACEALLKRGALAVQLTYPGEFPESEPNSPADKKGAGLPWLWAASQRSMHGPILLADTYEDTLSGLGKHTRRNLRASRRHAQAELGYTFIAEPVMSKEEFAAFNRASTHPESDEMTVWRYEAMKLLPDRLFLGIKGASGEWLSVIGGRRSQDKTIVEWQMNRAGLTKSSLSTLMRSHLFEHEVEHGCRRLYFVGGTPHSMKHSQAIELFVDFVAVRSRLLAFFLRRLARPLIGEKTFLVQTLADPKLRWHSWKKIGPVE
jgi:hypothetical protein